MGDIPSPTPSITGRLGKPDLWRRYINHEDTEDTEDTEDNGDELESSSGSRNSRTRARGRRRAEERRAKTGSGCLPVYVTIHRIRRLMLSVIDDPYTRQQLCDPRMTTLVVRPLVEKLYDLNDIAVIYCLMVNRVQFLRDQSAHVHHSVNVARATLCELVASRLLRRFSEAHPGSNGLLVLASILVGGFDPFDGSPDHETDSNTTWALADGETVSRKLTALELAIVSESKSFISSSSCQRLVQAIYVGRIVYTPFSWLDFLPDHYKQRPITLYNPRQAPLLNQYRLIVPRLRNILELMHFIILLSLYVATMLHRNTTNEKFEFAFCLFTAGWVLDELATIFEHGWNVRSQNLWSFLDASFTFIYIGYIVGRIYDISAGDFPYGVGLKILSVAAPVLLTRVAFNLMPQNIVFISLHAMVKNFTVLTFIAVWCFAGFLLGLQWMVSSTTHEHEQPVMDPGWATIGKWLLWIWFGLDGTGIEEAAGFHVILGPALMIAFAFLGNTLFLTILVAMLTNTFSNIIADENAEVQFRRTVLAFEGVKSDAIFAYPPPFNLLALAVLLPLKFVLSPRYFHKLHVALVRVVNFPTLLAIAMYERHYFDQRVQRRKLFHSGSARSILHRRKSFLGWQFTGLSVHGDVMAVFENPPPPNICETIERLDVLDSSDGEVETAAGIWGAKRRYSRDWEITLGRRPSMAKRPSMVVRSPKGLGPLSD